MSAPFTAPRISRRNPAAGKAVPRKPRWYNMFPCTERGLRLMNKTPNLWTPNVLRLHAEQLVLTARVKREAAALSLGLGPALELFELLLMQIEQEQFGNEDFEATAATILADLTDESKRRIFFDFVKGLVPDHLMESLYEDEGEAPLPNNPATESRAF